MEGKLWAVATYFNFGRFASKYINYQVFRAKLNVPLMTMEIAVDGEFELTERDADILIRLRRGDVMWQQHRLFNVAAASLPDHCEAVAFLDSDIVFSDPGWARNTMKQLERARLVQPFSHVQRLLPFQMPGTVRNKGMTGGLYAQPAAALKMSGATGIAWAACRDLAEEGPFYDAAVLGGGDRLSFHAAQGHTDEVPDDVPLSDAHTRHYKRWARRHRDRVDGKFGCIEGTVYTLWHGSGPNRQYVKRHTDLLNFDFDPEQDISSSSEGAWVWATDKVEMHRYIREYFNARREDGELMMGAVDGRPARIMKL